MDKAEYRIKLEEINRLAEQGDFAGAAAVADEVDWKHVKSVRTLCMVGEIYEANKRYEDSRRVLKLAYKRSSSSKTVLYRLAELDIRIGDFEEAKKFINEFEQNSPGDMSRFILRYKLLKAQNAPYDEQIAVLREYRDNEYTERWSYELAKLYKKNGQNEKCIEECDDMILWFAEGKYVRKAMELKMSLTSLTPSQQLKYEAMLQNDAAEASTVPEQEQAAPAGEADQAETAATETVSAENVPSEAGSSEEMPSEAAASEEPASNDAEAAAAEERIPEVQYGALETVEKSILEADEEDDEDEHESMDSGEMIRKMDTAAGRFNPKERDEEKKAASASSLQARITRGFKSIFSGMKLEEAEEETPLVVEEEKKPAPRVGAPESDDDLAEAFSFANQAVREREASKNGEFEDMDSDELKAAATENKEASEEAVAKDDEDADMKIVGEKKEAEEKPTEDIELENLLKETGSAFAGAVASGEFVLADTLEENLEEAEENARAAKERNEAAEEQPASEEDTAASEEGKREADLIGRETDESLGLTREFHFQKQLAEAHENGTLLTPEKDETERAPIEAPEEASRKLVQQHYGIDPEEEKADLPEEEEEEFEETSDTAEKAAEVKSEDANKDLLAAFDTEEDFSDLPEETIHDEGAAQEEKLAEVITDEEALQAEEEEQDVFELIPVEGRKLTEEEKKALSYFADIPGIDIQTTAALADIHNNCGDKTSRAGNVLIMGRQGSGKTRLADGLIMMTCMHLGLTTAKVGRIIANRLNGKDPAEVVRKLAGGFLLIEAAGELSDETVDRLDQAMNFRTDDLIVILEDEKSDLKAMLNRHPDFAAKFTSQITVPVFTNDELVTFAKTYAGEEGYKFDDMATLALYTMIGDNQKEAEPVTISKVCEMLDKAMTRSSHRIFGKIVDKEDGRVVLQEKDFNF